MSLVTVMAIFGCIKSIQSSPVVVYLCDERSGDLVPYTQSFLTTYISIS